MEIRNGLREQRTSQLSQHHFPPTLGSASFYITYHNISNQPPRTPTSALVAMARTRAQCAADLLDDTLDQPPQKRPRTSTAPDPVTTGPVTTGPANTDPATTDPVATDPIAFWVEHGTWPKRSSGAHLAMKSLDPIHVWNKPARPKFYSYSHYASSETPSDQRRRDEKSAPYMHPVYTLYLETKQGTYMKKSEQGITDTSKRLIDDLLAGEQQFPIGTIFDDSVFERAFLNLEYKNEARIIQDISRLIVPS